MIINITFPNHNTKRLVQEETGPSWSWKDRIKLGGIGSQKYRIIWATEEIMEHFKDPDDPHFGTIELRTRGLIFHFSNNHQRYGWLIPYPLFSVVKTKSSFEIHFGKNQLELGPANNQTLEMKFLAKLMTMKGRLTSRDSFEN